MKNGMFTTMLGLAAVFVMGASISMAAAEDTARVEAAGEQLGQSLGELKNSASRLLAGNEALVAANARLKAQSDVLRLRLKGLKAEEDRMSGEAAKLKMTRTSDAQRIAKMEKELLDLNGKAEDPSARKERLKILKMIYDSKQAQLEMVSGSRAGP
jgi:chromosome segregation ATPase